MNKIDNRGNNARFDKFRFSTTINDLRVKDTHDEEYRN